MSHAVVRGNPLPAQLYLDTILDEILVTKGKPSGVDRQKVNIAQILYHCLKKNPSNAIMINGVTGEVVTNGQILKQAISLARALISKGVKGKTVILLMRNHQRMLAMYFAVLFADTLPFLQDPNSTAYILAAKQQCANIAVFRFEGHSLKLAKLLGYETKHLMSQVEIQHFLDLIQPSIVFCDGDNDKKLREALEKMPELKTKVVVFQDEEDLRDFSDGSNSDVNDFLIPDKDPDAPVLMLPTSGSTGLPKAVMLNQKGLLAQIPGWWLYHTNFPKPTKLMMVLNTPQWATFTMTAISGVVYEIPRLLTPRDVSVDHVKDLLIKYRPTWTFFGTAFVKALLPEITPDHFSSLETLTVMGSACSIELKAAIQDKLPKTTLLCDAYGATEAQGHIALPDRDAPVKSNGRPINIFHYKLLDVNGADVGLCGVGELHLKGISCIEGYYKNEEAYSESFADGWYRTGDLFYIDENERLTFKERINLNFKFNGYYVSPEEVEQVIGTVRGVQECVVCCTELGPTAAVVVRPGERVTRAQIHAVVDASLSAHKRLQGGIVFVSSLPHTHSGKLLRSTCRTLVLKLLQNGTSFFD